MHIATIVKSAFTYGFSSTVSVVSLLVSMTVAWLTLMRRGTLHMTQPVQIAFVFEDGRAKVFLRTLLYATSVFTSASLLLASSFPATS
jgi:hypothetical protein